MARRGIVYRPMWGALRPMFMTRSVPSPAVPLRDRSMPRAPAHRRATWAFGLGIAIFLWALCISSVSRADASVWARARDERLVQEEELVREAQRSILRYRRMVRTSGAQATSLADLMLRDARRALAQVMKNGTRNHSVRLLYAEVLRDSNARDEAVVVLKKLLAEDPPVPIRADALAELALLHAHAGRREEEIRAYTDALEIEPHAAARARLLSNRAEAFMAMGDVTSAVEGYRAALAPLTTTEVYWVGPTTLFGLGVALDRLGNLDEALRTIKLARAYDPSDRGLRSPSWFFSPAHDSHWYFALGAWSCGRFSDNSAVRADCYNRSVSEWNLYVAEAPPEDRFLPIAEAHLATVTRERGAFMKAYEARTKAEKKTKGATKRSGDKEP